MPGVNVRTATRSGPVNAAVPAAGRYFVAGILERGRTDAPVRVRSLAELEVLFGGRIASGFVYDDLRTYFEEGGSEAYVLRVVGPAATLGTLTLMDGAGVPVGTVAVDSLGAYAGSTAVEVAVVEGSIAGTRKLEVYFGSVGDADAKPVESFDNLDSPAMVVTALEASRYVRGRNLGSVTAPPANLPAVAPRAPLTAGSADAPGVTAAVLVAALERFGAELGAGVVAIPGYPSSATAAGLKAHAKATRRLFLTGVAPGSSVADARNAAAALIAPDGEYGGLVYPHVRIPAPGGAVRVVPAEGYAAAMRARAHREAGPYRAPAGEIARARFVLGPERELTKAEGNELDEAGVSVIRTVAGSTRLYGWRSLSNDLSNYALLTGRDTLNVLAVEAEARLEQYVFRSIDGKGQLYGEVEAELIGLVDPMARAGGLFANVDDEGNVLDPGYGVDTGPTVNTQAVQNANTVAAVLAVRVSPVGTLIDLTIVKAGLTASV